MVKSRAADPSRHHSVSLLLVLARLWLVAAIGCAAWSRAQAQDNAAEVGPSAGALRGLKDTRWPMVFAAFAYWVVGISMALGLGFGAGLGGLGSLGPRCAARGDDRWIAGQAGGGSRAAAGEEAGHG